MNTSLPNLDDYDNIPHGEDPIDKINAKILRGDYDDYDDTDDPTVLNLTKSSIPLCPYCHAKDLELHLFSGECNSCGGVFEVFGSKY